MQFYSTNNKAIRVGFQEAVLQGLAPDNGLYMPVTIPKLSGEFFSELSSLSLKDIGQEVTRAFFSDDLPPEEIDRIVSHTIQFDAPVVPIEDRVFALELFHGPTMAFKDFGARFLSGTLGYLAKENNQNITILVATSGDTGSAVANGFLNIPGTNVVVLYPSGKVSEIQEKQFTTLGGNITALEVKGSFDDCQRLVKQAFLDTDLKEKLFLTSANSINIARLIPQSFYYFYAFGQLSSYGKPVVISIPSGNFGNLTGGLLAMKMGLPVKQFIASTNANDVVPEYFATQVFEPRPSQQTISNAMDVGNPSNFARLMDLYEHHYDEIKKDITGFGFTDGETREALRDVFASRQYCMDPHGAVGYLGLKKYLGEHPEAIGVFLETAHPAKFKDVVEDIIGQPVSIPESLQRFMTRSKTSIPISDQYEDFKTFLLS